MRGGAARSMWSSVPLAAWTGFLVGISNIATVTLAAVAIHALEGSPLGIQVSALDWLLTQRKTAALDMLAFMGIALSAGIVSALLLTPWALLSGRDKGFFVRAYHLAFVLLLLLLPGAVVFRMAAITSMYDDSKGPLFVIGIGILVAALIVLALYLFRRKIGNMPQGAVPLQSSFVIAGGALFIFGLRGLLLMPESHPYAYGSVWLALWLFVTWVIIRRLTSLSALLLNRRWPYPAFIGITVLAAVFLVISFTGVYKGPPKRDTGISAPNFLMIVMDTVRKDRLSVYGHHRDTTPTLEKLAKEGVKFERAFAAGPWTLPSHATFFTGLYPGRHWCNHEHLWLDDHYVTLAEIMRAEGYVTLGYSNNPIVGGMTGLDQGFDRFVEGWRPEMSAFAGAGVAQVLSWMVYPDLFPEDAGAADTEAVVERWFKDISGTGTPFFMFINYMEAHPPMPRFKEAFRYFDSEADALVRLSKVKADFVARNSGLVKVPEEQRDALFRLYDGEIRYMDDRIGKVLETLEQEGLSDNTYVIVLSDHGEMFDEHGGLWGHERTLYNSLLSVPLIIKGPGLPPNTIIDDTVSLRELPAMIMSLQKVQGPAPFLDAAIPADRDEVGGVLAEVARPVAFMKVVKKRFPGADVEHMDRRRKALISWPWKLIWDSKGDDLLYNIEKDPNETNDLTKENFSVFTRMSAEIQEYREKHPESENAGFTLPPMDDQTRDKLRALGYLP